MMKLFSQLSTDISIHALLAESDRCCPCAIIAPAISIHALLAESDAAIFFLYCAFPYFYPRSPCGERRFHFNAGQHICVISIHALLAESDLNFHHRRPCCFQFLSTLSLRRATRPGATRYYTRGHFYPRSPCGERLVVLHIVGGARKFLSTLSLRRATVEGDNFFYYADISIHALLAESDPLKSYLLPSLKLFLSTLSLRRATIFEKA